MRLATGSGRMCGSLACGVWVCAAVGCHRSPTPSTSGTERGDQPPPPPAAPTESPPALWPAEDDPDRWLSVEAAKEGADGGWATGSFDSSRNKLEIRTRDVRRFSIDTSRLSIDWNKLVALSIDGNSSELRKRDVTLLHFELDARGQWNVVEPPAAAP